MRSFMFIGDPQKQIEEWVEGEHKVLVISPSEEHDSTSRALTTLKAAGLEHDIVKTIVLDQEFLFGEGKIDEHLKSSTSQAHYPYIYINKEFIGDHRTIAYMDYQGTLVNTVGLVFLVSQDTSTRHNSSEYKKLDEEAEQAQDEEETATDRHFAKREEAPADKSPPPPPPPVRKEAGEHSPPVPARRETAIEDLPPPPPPPVGVGSRVGGSEKHGSLKDELQSAEHFQSAVAPTPDTVSSASCWSFATKSRYCTGSRSSSRKSNKDGGKITPTRQPACKTCKRQTPETTEVEVQTEPGVEGPASGNTLAKEDSAEFDYIS